MGKTLVVNRQDLEERGGGIDHELNQWVKEKVLVPVVDHTQSQVPIPITNRAVQRSQCHQNPATTIGRSNAHLMLATLVG